MPCPTRRAALVRSIDVPARAMLPRPVGSAPAMVLSSVDFPAPLGPTMPTASPGRMSKVMPCRTMRLP